MKIKLFHENVKLPTKSHADDAGWDLYLPQAITIKPLETICVGFGVGFQIPKGYAGIFVPRSSVAKKGLIIAPAIVDCGYTGETHLILTNCSNKSYRFEQGDRLCSMVVLKMLTENLELTNDLGISERGENGLGSSGK